MARRLVFALLIAAAAALVIALIPGAPDPDRNAPAAPAARTDPATQLPTCPERLPEGMPALVCRCTPEAMATGGVWGSDFYTDDSAICRAALHAGVAGVNGGPIRVVAADGRASYPGDIRNSVASSAWESWSRSITFRPVEGDAGPAR